MYNCDLNLTQIVGIVGTIYHFQLLKETLHHAGAMLLIACRSVAFHTVIHAAIIVLHVIVITSNRRLVQLFLPCLMILYHFIMIMHWRHVSIIRSLHTITIVVRIIVPIICMLVRIIAVELLRLVSILAFVRILWTVVAMMVAVIIPIIISIIIISFVLMVVAITVSMVRVC